MSSLPTLLLSLIAGGLLPLTGGCHPSKASHGVRPGSPVVLNGVVTILPARAGRAATPSEPLSATVLPAKATPSGLSAVGVTPFEATPPEIRPVSPAKPAQTSTPTPLPAPRVVEFVSASLSAGEVHVIPFTRRLASGSAARSEHIVVPVRLNDGRAHAFLLDTGAQATTVVVPKELVQLPSVRHKVQGKPTVLVQGVGGHQLPAWRLMSDSLAVGAARRDRMEYLLLPMPARGPGLGDSTYGPIMGVLGNDFLSKFLLTIDYDRSVVILTER